MNIYQKEAKNILKAVGENNFNNIFHCVSRLRFEILDKKSVNLEIIKESKLIKGINWSNNQLQIILGTGIVEAIYQETKDLLSNSNSITQKNTKTIKNKNSKFYFLNKFMQVLSDIFLPIIPAIVAAGISMGLTSLIKTILKNYDYSSNSFFWTIADVINTTAFSGLAVLVCWSSTKRFGGNPILGIIVGLMLISPFLP
ncbi:MAG: hypothetical protein E7Y34_01350, partial [Mycoplasma sp.]|nr:hypothetical protein [Mycoplasma sp.]